jgi:hypothetical protein
VLNALEVDRGGWCTGDYYATECLLLAVLCVQ